jgi:hypothetical protein
MNSPEIKEFIKEYSYLFWSTAEDKKENISHELLVETILNYGELPAVKKLFELVGLEETARIFCKAEGRQIGNYLPMMHNFFTLYFKRHTPRVYEQEMIKHRSSIEKNCLTHFCKVFAVNEETVKNFLIEVSTESI